MQAAERLDLTFAALADTARRAILARLATGEALVQELAAPFAMSQPAIARHLKVLGRAGLISKGVDAQRRPRPLEPQRLEEAVDWIEHYREIWEQNYHAWKRCSKSSKPNRAGASEARNSASPSPRSARVFIRRAGALTNVGNQGEERCRSLSK